jgi:hypothetical protein
LNTCNCFVIPEADDVNVLSLPVLNEHCIQSRIDQWSKLKLKLILDRQSVGQSVLVSGAHLGPVTNISLSLKFPSDSCVLVIL